MMVIIFSPDDFSDYNVTDSKLKLRLDVPFPWIFSLCLLLYCGPPPSRIIPEGEAQLQ